MMMDDMMKQKMKEKVLDELMQYCEDMDSDKLKPKGEMEVMIAKKPEMGMSDDMPEMMKKDGMPEGEVNDDEGSNKMNLLGENEPDGDEMDEETLKKLLMAYKGM